MKKIIVPGLVTGIAMLIISLVSSPVFSFIFPELSKQYQTPGLFRPWSDPLMSLIFVHPFLLGLILAWFWDKTKVAFKEKGCRRGVCFGLSIWLVASLPGMLISYSSFPLSLTMIISWSLGGLAQVVAAGWVLAKMSK